METAGLVVFIVVALGFDFTNGFHDAANAIATAVSTRALTPRAALGLAAVFNLIGAVVSTKVAGTISKGIIADPKAHVLLLFFAAVIGAIIWNLVTWYFGLPSSSSHALIGGLVGAGLAASNAVKWHGVVQKVVIPMVLSPLVGFVLGFLVMLLFLWIFRHGRPQPLNRAFRRLQIASSAAMAYGHGLQDAQKTMGVITFALVATHHLNSKNVPLWVIFAAATAISLGTYSGGWRIMRTLGRRVIKMDALSGFTAQTVASSVLMTTAYVFAAPISTTHVITSSVMGVGATRKLSAVRWGVAGNIAGAWVLTLPASGLIAAAAYGIGRLITG